MDKLKRMILLQIPTTICNLECQYCYLPKRNDFHKGDPIVYHYSPEHVAKALSKERLGGACFINLCAAGETLLAKDIDQYLYALLKEGHYCEFVSNMTVTKVLDRICQWDRDILSHLEFKCSFHYLQLKERGLLDVFADNVNKCWKAGASVTVEITPHDELIPYIEEIKEFSMEKFGALPHITIARDDSTEKIVKLTALPEEEYKKVWGQFDSDFWKFKMTIFGEKRKEFCYAGDWLLDVDLATGYCSQCYCTKFSQNVFENPDKPIAFYAYGKDCACPHCFNGHSMLTLGCIPNFTDVTYAQVRDRVRADGTHWLQGAYAQFISQKLEDNNQPYSSLKQATNDMRIFAYRAKNKVERTVKKTK